MFDDMLSQSEIDALLDFRYDGEDENFFPDELGLYDFDSLFKVVQQIYVPYPEYLVNELKTCFKNNKKFIDALDDGKANAISYLDDLQGYSKNKRQLDAYSNLYSWLIENDIEFTEKSEEKESSDNEISEGDHEKVEGSNEEQKQNDKPTERSSKKMNESQKNENGNVEDGSHSKSSEKTDKIQENKDGQISREEQGQQSNNSSQQSSSQQLSSSSSSQKQSSLKSNQQTQAQKQASGSGKQGNKEEKKSLKDRLKSALGIDKSKPSVENKTTLPQKEQSINEIKKDIKQPNPMNKEMLKILSEIQKELEDMQENDSDDEKIESDQDNEHHDLVRPGGRQISKTKAEEIVKEWIERLAISGVHLKTSGYEKWDKKKIAKYVVTEQEWKIPTAKYKHLPDKIMFMLDFSGSCSWISKTFAQLGHAATHYDHVVVAYGGYEGYVQGFITKDTDVNNIEHNLHRNGFYGLGYGESADKYEDVSLGTYLQQNRDIKTCIILGDYDGTQRYVDAYLRNRHVKFTWFLCERYSNYRGHIDLYGLKNHIYYFDGSVEGLARLVKTYK